MSFDVAVWSQVHRSVKQASQVYLKLCDNDTSLLQPQPDSAQDIEAFLQELTQRYPPPSAYTDETADECLWSNDFDISEAHVLLSIPFSRVAEAAAWIVDLAYKHHLIFYNPQNGTIRLPQRQ